jgi:hypothetical protein
MDVDSSSTLRFGGYFFGKSGMKGLLCLSCFKRYNFIEISSLVHVIQILASLIVHLDSKLRHAVKNLFFLRIHTVKN